MKISVDDEELFTLSKTQKKVIMNDIHEDDFEDDMKRRLHYILMHKYEVCFDRLKHEWDPKLSLKYDTIPTDPDKYAELVFKQKDYRSRKKRDSSEKS